MYASTPSRLVLALNLNRLMVTTRSLNSNTKLVKHSGLGLGTIGRLRNAEAAATIDTLDRLAKCFGMQPWQLLIPQDVAQPPHAAQTGNEFQPEIKPDELPPRAIQLSSMAQELSVLFDLLTNQNEKNDQSEVFSVAVKAISRAVTGR